MAIIDSVLVGKGRGKIGNVVLQGIKGQTVAKQLNPAPSNPRTVSQTDSRNRMSNVVMAWQFLSVFFAFAGALRKPLESTYNAFVRMYKNYVDNVLKATRVEAAINAFNSFQFGGNWIQITNVALTVGHTEVTFNTSGLPYVAGTHVQLIGIDSSGQAFTIANSAITETQWNAQSFSAAVLGSEYFAVAAYIYSPDQSKISSLGYVEA